MRGLTNKTDCLKLGVRREGCGENRGQRQEPSRRGNRHSLREFRPRQPKKRARRANQTTSASRVRLADAIQTVATSGRSLSTCVLPPRRTTAGLPLSFYALAAAILQGFFQQNIEKAGAMAPAGATSCGRLIDSRRSGSKFASGYSARRSRGACFSRTLQTLGIETD